MSPRMAVSYLTIVRKELHRLFRLWTQTILPSAITTTLYFVIFGAFIGSQVKPVGHYTYMQFIVPGLIMMAIVTNAFQQTVSGFYMAKFSHSIEEILVSPTPSWLIVAGYVSAGIVRGCVVGSVVWLISMLFSSHAVHNLPITLAFGFLTAMLFASVGLLNALFAKTFDHVAIVPTFVLNPLTYLGGVFYSITLLPPFWQSASKLNPILYMINGFRYGILGTSDVSVGKSLALLLLCVTLSLGYSVHLMRHSKGVRM